MKLGHNGVISQVIPIIVKMQKNLRDMAIRISSGPIRHVPLPHFVTTIQSAIKPTIPSLKKSAVLPEVGMAVVPVGTCKLCVRAVGVVWVLGVTLATLATLELGATITLVVDLLEALGVVPVDKSVKLVDHLLDQLEALTLEHLEV